MTAGEEPTGTPPLRFHGPPGAVRALVAADRIPGLVEAAALELVFPEVSDDAQPTSVPVTAAPAGAGAAWLQAALPETAPAGRLDALLRVGGSEVPVVVEILAQPRLLASPASAVVTGAPGERVAFTLTVANVGNTSVVIPRTAAFGLMEDEGVEDAIGAALRSSSDGAQRLAVLADALADRHGGLALVSLPRGYGELRPGEVRDLEPSLRLPTDVRPERVYTGNWPLAALRFHVEVRVRRSVVT